MKIKMNYKDLKMETIYKSIGAVLTALLLLACITLVMVVKDNQEQIKGLYERIEVLEKNESDFSTPKQPLRDGEITKKYMIDDDCMIEVWDSQFKTLRLYTVDFDEWKLMKVGEVW